MNTLVCKKITHYFNNYIVILLLLAFSASVYSQDAIENFATQHDEMLHRFQNMALDIETIENFDPVSGTISFSAVDIDIPGNFNIPVQLRRRFDPGSTGYDNDALGSFGSSGISHREIPNGDEDVFTAVTYGPWTLDVPYIKGTYVLPVGKEPDDYLGEESFEFNLVITDQEGWYSGNVCDGGTNYTVSYSTFSQQGSMVLGSEKVWSGKLLHIPGKVTEKFLENYLQSEAPFQRTKSNYYISDCFQRSDGKGQGIVVKAPNGDVYEFGYSIDFDMNPTNSEAPTYRVRKMMLVTKITDKFGNTVDYSWINNKLTKISASDGREINLHYEGNVLTKATANGKEWLYEASAGKIGSVTYPDGTTSYYGGLYNLDRLTTPALTNKYYEPIDETQSEVIFDTGHCEKSDKYEYNTKTASVKTRSGATVNYYFEATYHGSPGRSGNVYEKLVDGGTRLQQFATSFNCTIYWSLHKKEVTGPGIEPQTWLYSYSENRVRGDRLANSIDETNLPDSVVDGYSVKTTKVITPENTKVYYIDRDYKSITYNKILAVDTFADQAATNLLERQMSYYEMGDYVAENWMRGGGQAPNDRDLSDKIGQNEDTVERRINQVKHVTVRYYSDGQDTFVTESSDFDEYGFVRLRKEYNDTSNIGYNTRFTRTTYLHQPWDIIGQHRMTETSIDGTSFTATNETIYHDFSNTGLYQSWKVPYEFKRFGSWVKRYTNYHDDGNVKRVEFNAPMIDQGGAEQSESYRYQELSNYKRGIPQSIILPNRYNHMQTQGMSRVVNDDGWVTSMTDLNGITRSYFYDEMGLLIGVDQPGSWLDLSVSWSKDSDLGWSRTASQCTLNASKTDCEPSTAVSSTTSNYDGLWRIIKSQESDVVNNTHRYTTYRFNTKNQLTFSSYSSSSYNYNSGYTTTYDGMGRKQSIAQSGGGAIGYTYLKNNKIKTTDPEGNQTTTTFQAFGAPENNQPIQIASPESVTTQIWLNQFGNVSAIVQSGPNADNSGTLSQTESRKYDQFQRLCLVQRRDVGNTAFINNGVGQVKWMKQGYSGTSCPTVSGTDMVLNTYDNHGALHKINFFGGAEDISFTLDGNGNKTKIESTSVLQTYSYNSLNQLELETLQVDDKFFSLDYGFDANGSLNSLTYPDGTVISFTPNGFGQPSEVLRNATDTEQAFSYVSDVKYYANGHVDSYSYGNGITHKTVLDARQLPRSIFDGFSTSDAALSYSYTYDLNQNVSSIIDNVNAEFSILSLQYDGLDRLTGLAGNTGIGNSSLRYDGLGNITYYKTKDRTLNYNYNTLHNRLTSVSGYPDKYAAFTYDASGNIRHNGSRAFTFDRANKLVSSENISFKYDGFNRRVKTQNAEKVSYSMYSQSGRLLYRETEFGPINYVYLGSKLVAKDGFIPRASGQQHYQPYGESIEGAADDVGFTGHKYDTALGLSYMQARYYDPVIGRFYSNDPVDALGHMQRGNSIAHGFNRYAYANNNPYKYTDPDGEFIQFIVGAVIGAATTYNSIKDSDMSIGQKAGAMAVGTLVGGASGGIGTLINMAKGAGTVASLTTGALAGGGSEATTQLINGQEIDGVEIARAALEGAVAAVSGNVVAGVTVQGNAKSKVAQEVKEKATAIVETATASLVQMGVDELQKD